jgi:hypothetical protein
MLKATKQSPTLTSRSARITAAQCARRPADREEARIRGHDLGHGRRCRGGEDAGLVLLLLLLQRLLHQERLLLLLLPEPLLLLLVVAAPGAVHLLLRRGEDQIGTSGRTEPAHGSIHGSADWGEQIDGFGGEFLVGDRAGGNAGRGGDIFFPLVFFFLLCFFLPVVALPYRDQRAEGQDGDFATRD